MLLDRPYNPLIEELPIPKIADFGLSGEIDGKIMGYTPRFTAHEIINKFVKVRDFKSDIFSFGMVMYEIIEQHKPFYNIKNDKMVNMIIGEGELFKIEGDKWTPELKNICLKCLNFNPIARPTAKEIVDLLNNI